jgi:hypothetical protein
MIGIRVDATQNKVLTPPNGGVFLLIVGKNFSRRRNEAQRTQGILCLSVFDLSALA